MTNSRAKGARVEREAAAFLTSIGFPAQRNARNGKSADDIVVPSLPGVHFEVKGDRSIGLDTKALTDALMQSKRDTPPNPDGWFTLPVVLWKEHKKGWRLTYVDLRHGAETTVAGGDIANVLKWAKPKPFITRDDAGKE